MALTQPHDLVVVHPFDGYARGAKITDDVEIARILEGENAHHVHRVAPEPVAEAPATSKSKKSAE